jgi:hypothetical protein
MAFAYNMRYFEAGAMLDTILAFEGGGYQDTEIKAFIETIKANHIGVAGSHGVPVLNLKNGGKLQAINVKQSRQDMSFDSFLSYIISGVASIYGMPAEEINYASRARTDTAGLFQGDKGKQVEMNREQGFLARANHLKQTMDIIVKRHDPELEFMWKGVDNTAEDRRRKKAIEDKSILSVRERRTKLGYKPVPYNMTDNDVDQREDPIWSQGRQMQQQEKMAKIQAKQQQDAQKQAATQQQNQQPQPEEEDPENDQEFMGYIKERNKNNEE